jgi:hypothetical protein
VSETDGIHPISPAFRRELAFRLATEVFNAKVSGVGNGVLRLSSAGNRVYTLLASDDKTLGIVKDVKMDIWRETLAEIRSQDSGSLTVGDATVFLATHKDEILKVWKAKVEEPRVCGSVHHPPARGTRGESKSQLWIPGGDRSSAAPGCFSGGDSGPANAWRNQDRAGEISQSLRESVPPGASLPPSD